MPLAADFRVVNDVPHKLAPGQQIDFCCEIPPNLSRSDARAQSVIFVKFNLEGASGLTWELYLNGSLLLTPGGSGNDLILTMEARRFRGSRARRGSGSR